ncbi:M48 family metallopeptidase [uncultured Peptoniphilus sp.]|uniref:M48 family metallopeptidase n=1 Tax=uncultured Peptoniphilus sp. TaxID=254354 RepID=UPI00262578BF|nr:SprT-like domain-containing protein [uncultured Peptoniphilus sp.]
MNIEIYRKKVKNLRIKVEDGIIKVSAPLRTSEREIKRIVENNLDIIERLKEEDLRKRRYKNHLFGEKLEITSEKELEKIYRSELKKALDEIFEKYENLTGLSPKSVEIRKMKVRWGTCYPQSGAIKINLYLAERPREEIEAVVLHELVHLKYFYHDKKFKEECKKYMPNYEEIERDLKRW